MFRPEDRALSGSLIEERAKLYQAGAKLGVIAPKVRRARRSSVRLGDHSLLLDLHRFLSAAENENLDPPCLHFKARAAKKIGLSPVFPAGKANLIFLHR